MAATDHSLDSTGQAATPQLAVTSAKSPWKKSCRIGLLALLLIYLLVGLYQTCLKPLPADLSLEGERVPLTAGDIEFLHDITGMKNGRRVSEQRIFDRALQVISEAQDFVLIDLFLFNDYLGKARDPHRKLSREVTNALLEKKRTHPGIHVVVITDPVNEAYGGPVPEQFKALQAAGIPIVFTNLKKLRDSNPVYSTFWRMCVQWFGASAHGWMPHPFAKDAGRVSLRSWLSLLNFKANHRKLIVADAPAPDGGRQMVALVMSANPHDASSAHGNVGLLVRRGIWKDLLRGEQAVLSFSGSPIRLDSWLPASAQAAAAPRDSVATARVLTEGKIRKSVVELVAGTGAGDSIDIGMFYLSERRVVDALLDATRRGVSIRLLLDPNRDAFGYQKNGIPNRPVAAELRSGGAGKIAVRWYDTHGEQFHTKLVLVKQAGQATLLAGSANLTRRNVGDFNLETDLAVTGPPDLPVFRAAGDYFERLWTNRDLDCSVPYETFVEKSKLKYWQYRLQEWSGLSTF